MSDRQKAWMVTAMLLSMTACNTFDRPDIREHSNRFGSTLFGYSVVEGGDGDTSRISFQGEVSQDSAAALTNAIERSNNLKEVYLTSDGGLIFEAYGLNALIHDRDASTIAEQDCLSACALIFMAGTKRIVNKDSALGFHMISAWSEEQDQAELDESLQTIWQTERKYWNSRGVSDWFLDQVEATPPDDMWYPSLNVLIMQNIVTHVRVDDQLLEARQYCQSHDCER